MVHVLWACFLLFVKTPARTRVVLESTGGIKFRTLERLRFNCVGGDALLTSNCTAVSVSLFGWAKVCYGQLPVLAKLAGFLATQLPTPPYSLFLFFLLRLEPEKEEKKKKTETLVFVFSLALLKRALPVSRSFLTSFLSSFNFNFFSFLLSVSDLESDLKKYIFS